MIPSRSEQPRGWVLDSADRGTAPRGEEATAEAPAGDPADGKGERAADPIRLVRQAAGDDPLSGLPAVRQLRLLIDRWEDAQVALARRQGMNWAEIARLLNRHRQAVHREYAGRETKEPS